MGPPRRFLFSLHAIFILLLLAASVHTAQAQSPAASSIQLPPKWNDTVHAFAEKLAGCAAPSRKISLDVKNISSMDSSAVMDIRQALQSELSRKGLKQGSGGVPGRVTLSEGSQGYIWVAECGQSDAKQIAIVFVSKEAVRSADKEKKSLSLDKKLVWEQPEKFVDFALFTRPVELYSTLVILEPERLVYYRSTDGQWQPWKSIPVPHQGPWPRDLHGVISTSSNLEVPWLPGVQCSGDLEDPDKVECGPSKKQLPKSRLRFNVPGHEQGELAALWNRCGPDWLVLASGTGDWTQPDTIQGYLLPNLQEQAVPSGGPLTLDGPVMDLQPQGTESAARAVVQNLKTGNFEAYLVTATCSH